MDVFATPNANELAEHISDYGIIDHTLYIDYWNDDGVWSFVMNYDDGKIKEGFFKDYGI